MLVAQGTQAGGKDALADLQACLETMKDVKTLQVGFVCEKRLAALETPLVSSGRLWIRKGAKDVSCREFRTLRRVRNSVSQTAT